MTKGRDLKHRFLGLAAGGVALAGGVFGLLNPVAAQVASTTVAGWVLLVVGLVQGRAAVRSHAMREKAGAMLFAAAALVLGLSLVFGPFGQGGVLRLFLGGLLLVSGGAKLWMARGMRRDAFFAGLVGGGVVSLVLGVLVLAGAGLQLGVIMSIELLASGVALIVLAMRSGHAGRAG